MTMSWLNRMFQQQQLPPTGSYLQNGATMGFASGKVKTLATLEQN